MASEEVCFPLNREGEDETPDSLRRLCNIRHPYLKVASFRLLRSVSVGFPSRVVFFYQASSTRYPIDSVNSAVLRQLTQRDTIVKGS
ncbi:unnamed protein product [Lasius platythorax]|uniref:Uncharacterized protein n=1 Tax=Lasius platythorax TaxID=488582 RepID=A0AAV2P7A3_9HYME